jgi:hypothetical protein
MSTTTHSKAIARTACLVAGSLSALLAFALLGPGTARADVLAIPARLRSPLRRPGMVRHSLRPARRARPVTG